MRVVQIGQYKLVLDNMRGLKSIRRFRNYGFPGRLRRVAKVDRNNATSGSIVVRADVEDGAIVADRLVGGIELIEHLDDSRFDVGPAWILKIDIVEPVFSIRSLIY